jgi:hypothetical protein
MFTSLGLYYGVALARVSEAEVNLLILKEGIENNKICHEDCLLIRRQQEALIISALSKSEKALLERLEQYWLDPLVSFDFKFELINLWSLNNNLEIVPQYFYDYLDQEDGDVKLQTKIISSFLAPDRDKSWLPYYFSLLSSGRDKSLKKEALGAISSRSDKQDIFTLKQLELLKALVINNETPIEIKADLVLLISEYYIFFPEEARTVLMDIYKNTKLDNITRAFAADILNQNNSELKLLTPFISEAEWEKYYNY